MCEFGVLEGGTNMNTQSLQINISSATVLVTTNNGLHVVHLRVFTFGI